MAVYTELDKWAWDIEQELISNNNRSKLQRKLMEIEKVRDRIHKLFLEEHYFYRNENPPPLNCRERVFGNNPPPCCKSSVKLKQ